MYYAESYDRSVYTNSIGVFSFTKPSQYCSYTIDIATLPEGWGVSKHTQFIVPQRKSDTVTAAPIATAEASLDGDRIKAEFADANGNRLYTDYEVIPGGKLTPGTGGFGSFSTSEMVMTYSALKAYNSYTYSGIISAGGKRFPYSISYDLSDYSEMGKADFLYSKGIITEDQKYSFYIDYLDDDTVEHIFCGTAIYGELETYLNSKSSENLNVAEGSTIYSTMSSIPTYVDYFDIEISAANGGPYCFRVFYQDTFIEYDLKNLLGENLKKIYKMLVYENSFLAPVMYTNSSSEQYFPIYVIDDNDVETMSSSSKGLMRIYQGSYLAIIREEAALGYEEIIAHEFMHAVLHRYTNVFTLPDWFSESLANLNGIVFSNGTIDSTKNQIKAYKQKCDLSINYTGNDAPYHPYGAVLYPLYIHKYLGGWSTIRQIMANYSTYNNPYLSITSALSSGTYSTAFAAMAAYNYNTGQFYEQYGGEYWGYVKEWERHLVDLPSEDSVVNPMATQYEVYNSAAHDMTLNLTIQIVSGSSSGLIYKKICQSTTGDIVVSTVVPTGGRITVTNFGHSDCENFILAVVNSVYTNSAVRYIITPSLSQ